MPLIVIKTQNKMKKICLSILSIGVVLFTLVSCTGNNNADQQQVAMPTAQQQPVQTPPADTTMAQAQPQAAAPAASIQVPDAINAFVKQNFPNATIAGVEQDSDHGGMEYDIYLSDGTKVDFDANSQWDKVECHAGVPASLVPQAIANYVKSNYQNMTITKIDREFSGYEIELSNGLDLKFDKSGRFMGMDD